MGQEVLFLACLGALLAETDDVEGAERAMAEARGRLAAQEDAVMLQHAVALCHGVVDLARARAAEAAMRFREARARRERVRQLRDGRPDLSLDALLAGRLLARAIARERPAPAARAAAGAPAGPLEVGPDARWVLIPGRGRIDLARRRSTRLVLLALTRARLSTPGKGLDGETLIESAWPGERMLHHAGLARVYTTIRALRALGLGDGLLTRDDGYLLDPDLVVRLMP
jgi:hypothetical protein